MKSIDNFNYVTSAVLTPLFLVAGTFFPIDELPAWAQVARPDQPALPQRRARPARRLRVPGLVDMGHVAVLVGFALVMWRVAVARMTRRLVI